MSGIHHDREDLWSLCSRKSSRSWVRSLWYRGRPRWCGVSGLPHPVVGGAFDSPVRPGTGWPEDVATAATPVAQRAEDVRHLATDATGLSELAARVSVCRACPRLVAWREEVAVSRRRSFADQPYWGRPLPGWGDDNPRLLVLGLAPAAHGGNRTGRIFTGDRSGDWLFAGLHRTALAVQPTSVYAGDGQRLVGTRVAAAVRCAPPANAPTPLERETCAPWLDREVALVLPQLRSVVALGSFAWSVALQTLSRAGFAIPRPRPRFGHGVEQRFGQLLLIGCYHPSQQNTFTGKLTEPMLDAVLTRAAHHADLP
jgi:uracil-DNA glycosylase